jgi:drug/metabolite transporter (DMT)-like permease
MIWLGCDWQGLILLCVILPQACYDCHNRILKEVAHSGVAHSGGPNNAVVKIERRRRESNGLQKKMLQYWWLILLSVLCGVGGQTVIKIGVSRPGAAEAAAGFLPLVGMIIRSPLVLAGLVLYGLGALAWIAVLARVDLSVAYPFLALNFILVTLSSQFLLGEKIPGLRWLGVLVICSGIFLVARSSI